MATFDDVRRIALALPETSEGVSRGTSRWTVRDKGFVWDRPLRPADLQALGAGAPPGDVLGVRVADLVAKQELLAADPAVYFTTPHFDNYPAVLLRLERISVAELQEVVTDAWLVQAPRRVAQAYLAEHPE